MQISNLNIISLANIAFRLRHEDKIVSARSFGSKQSVLKRTLMLQVTMTKQNRHLCSENTNDLLLAERNLTSSININSCGAEVEKELSLRK